MADNADLKLTLDAWAKIVIDIWENKLIQKDANHSHSLINSFAHHIVTNAGGDVERIEFAFNYYGKFVDMGVGKGVTFENYDTMRMQGLTTRKKKSWYKGTWYMQVEKLVELLEEKFERKAAIAITEGLNTE